MNFASPLAASVLALASCLLPSISNALEFPQPRIADQCESIREKIEALPATGGIVNIEAGRYDCIAPVIIAKNNVVLRGAGRGKTILRLADNVHEPLLVIGHPHTELRDGVFVTPWRVSNIKVEGMTFDGNKANHDVSKECGETHCDGDPLSIRNNAISIRGASYVTIKNVTAHDSISGGLVTEKICDNLRIENFESHSNHFDGFAGYETEKSEFINVNLHSNRGAGISIDIRFNNNVFRGGSLHHNGDVGIFARDLHGNIFDGLAIMNNGSFGAFLAATAVNHRATCANDNVFRNVRIYNSKNAAIRINDGCTGTRIEGDSVMKGNGGGCVSDNGQTKVESTVQCLK